MANKTVLGLVATVAALALALVEYEITQCAQLFRHLFKLCDYIIALRHAVNSISTCSGCSLDIAPLVQHQLL